MKYLATLTAFSVLFVLSMKVSAEESKATRAKHYNLSSSLAIKGYDPVAYFTKDTAVKGNKDFTATHLGVRYHFSNAKHLELFKKNPTKYEPQHGGWCSYAFADSGKKVKINPKRFKIIDGKLYLFYDGVGTNTLKLWNKGNDSSQVKQADKTWAKIVN